MTRILVRLRLCVSVCVCEIVGMSKISKVLCVCVGRPNTVIRFVFFVASVLVWDEKIMIRAQRVVYDLCG